MEQIDIIWWITSKRKNVQSSKLSWLMTNNLIIRMNLRYNKMLMQVFINLKYLDFHVQASITDLIRDYNQYISVFVYSFSGLSSLDGILFCITLWEALEHIRLKYVCAVHELLLFNFVLGTPSVNWMNSVIVWSKWDPIYISFGQWGGNFNQLRVDQCWSSMKISA